MKVTFRQSFVRDLKKVKNQAVLDRDDVSTTMIYTHASNRGGRAVYGPSGRLCE